MSDDVSTTGVFDCDTHIYEPRDAATRYLPEEYLERRSIRTIRNPKDEDVVLAGSRIANFLSEEGLGFEKAYRPGSLREMLASMASGNPDEAYKPEPMRPEFMDRDLRMPLLDEQNVAKAVVFPGALALAAENYVSTDVDALYANIASYNRWYNEAWGFNYQDRIYATALMSLRDLDKAVENVEDIIDKGAKVALLPTGPAYGRSPGDPYFDPVWSRLNEAGVVIALHIQPNWYFEAMGPAWGQDIDPPSWHMSAWQWMNSYGERPVVDTLSALIFDNVFGRFPNLNVLVAEHGASWVPHTLTHMDKSRGMGRNGPWIGGQLAERPSAIFRRHVRVSPYPEDDIVEIIRQLDGDDSTLVFGSDFPHPEGVAHPDDFEAGLAGLAPDVQRRIMRGNAEAIFGTVG
jgi:predicted TIM-barrel fold metal-dependent hydrolase